MSMSLLDVVPLPGGARKSLQERSVEPQQGTVAVEAGAVTEAGGAKGFPEKGLEGVVSRPLVGAMLLAKWFRVALKSLISCCLGEGFGEAHCWSGCRRGAKSGTCCRSDCGKQVRSGKLLTGEIQGAARSRSRWRWRCT
jgi:hypothetical protein